MPNSQKDLHKKLLGRFGENEVVKFLKKSGYKLVKRNFVTPFGEADIVACKDETVFFVEVKTRSNEAFGLPREAVDYKKQERYRKMATFYIQQKGECDISFMVAEVTPDGINLIENAF